MFRYKTFMKWILKTPAGPIWATAHVDETLNFIQFEI